MTDVTTCDVTAGDAPKVARLRPGTAGLGLALVAASVGIPSATASASPVDTASVPVLPKNAIPTRSVSATKTAPVAHPSAVAPAAPTPLAKGSVTYTVKAGDTVSHIALRTGSSVSAIIKANNLNSNALIRVGQKLTIPNATKVTKASSTKTAPSSSASSYTVKAGDTVSHIAVRTGSSISAIIKANNLNSNALIRIGQKLTIPSSSTPSTKTSSTSKASGTATQPKQSATTTSTYTVKAGDTVSHIAARTGSSISAIIKANNLNSNALIRVGQKLTIPNANTGTTGSTTSTPKPSTPKVEAPKQQAKTTTYTVKAGDTLSRISSQYGTTVSAIVNANNLKSSSLIQVGQKLTIPPSDAPTYSGEQLVGNTFLGRTYPDATVNAANANKATLLSRSVPSKAQMQEMVRSTALEMGVDPRLAQAIAMQESGFDQRAVSPANAIGTMQVIPTSGQWASDLVGRQLDLLDPKDNVVAGVAILRALTRTSSSLDVAIASYYQGQGSVTRNGMFDDTRRYVANVRTLMNRF